MTSSPVRAVFAPLQSPAGATLGALLAALVDIVASNVTTTFLSPFARLSHAAWEIASFVTLGAAIDLLVYASTRVAARLWLVPFAAISGWAVYALLSDWLVHRAHHTLHGRHVELLLAATICGMGAAPAVCLFVGHWLSHRLATRVLATLVALAAFAANLSVLRDDYAPLHVYLTTLTLMLVGSALAPRLKLAAHAQRKLALGALLLAALACVPPPNHVRVALMRSPGAAAAWLLATTYWRLPRATRHELAAHAPRALTTPQLTAAPVVVLLTIDAVRADLLADPARARQLPTLTRLAREGVSFSQARAPGSQTAVTLTATFAGKHASELAWAPYGTGDYRHLYAAADPTPRWPLWLTARGIDTYKVVSLAFLANPFGVAPGFAEERMVTRGKAHALGTRVIEPLLAHLEAAAAKPQPCFVYAHLTEPHEPYDRGALATGPAFERYFSEVVLADALLGRIVERLATPRLAERALLVVTSDHGEAFGEHGTREHSKTLYDELLRVPLVFWGKSIVPRTLTQPVSLIDLGPTLLDLFGIPTPDALAGESLLPLLAGRDVTLTRPIIAEGRLRRALILGSRKLIIDERVHTLEAYDLASDPGELDNLYDAQPERFADMLSALQTYFDTREYRAVGYERKFRQ